MKRLAYILTAMLAAFPFLVSCQQDNPDREHSIIVVNKKDRTPFDDWLDTYFVHPCGLPCCHHDGSHREVHVHRHLRNIMNSQDQMAVYQELEQKGYLNYATTANDSESGIYGKMYELITLYDKTSGQFGLENTDEARAAYLRAAEMRNTNWFDRLFTYNIQHNHSVSMSGGTDKGNYYASLSIMDDPGWTLQSSVQRYTGNINSTFRILKNLSLNVITNASYRTQKAPGTLGSSVDVVRGAVKRDFDINPYSYALNTSRALDPNEFYTRNYAPFNIIHELENNYMDLDVTNLRFQGELKWKLL